MCWVAVDKNGDEYVYGHEPFRYYEDSYWSPDGTECVFLPKGSIEKLIGRVLTWEDEPVELS